MTKRKQPETGPNQIRRLLATATTHGRRFAFQQRHDTLAASRARFSEPYEPRGPVRRGLKVWLWEKFACKLPSHVKAWLQQTAKANHLNMGWLVLIIVEFLIDNEDCLNLILAWGRARRGGASGSGAAGSTPPCESTNERETK